MGEEDSEILITAKALEAAKKAFEDYLESDGYDPAYWDIRFTAWQLYATDFKRGERMEIEKRGAGDD